MPSPARTSDPLFLLWRRLLRGWLGLGALALLLLPGARGDHALIGWLPYWLLIAPLLSLAVLERVRWSAALAGFLVAGRRRGRRPHGSQARRLPHRRPTRRLGLAALLSGP